MTARRLAGEIAAMPPEEIAARLEWARNATPGEIVERQKVERCERAERAAARWQL